MISFHLLVFGHVFVGTDVPSDMLKRIRLCGQHISVMLVPSTVQHRCGVIHVRLLSRLLGDFKQIFFVQFKRPLVHNSEEKRLLLALFERRAFYGLNGWDIALHVALFFPGNVGRCAACTSVVIIVWKYVCHRVCLFENGAKSISSWFLRYADTANPRDLSERRLPGTAHRGIGSATNLHWS